MFRRLISVETPTHRRRRTGTHQLMQTTQPVATLGSNYGICSRHKLVESPKTVPLKQRQNGEFPLNMRFCAPASRSQSVSVGVFGAFLVRWSWACAVDNRPNLSDFEGPFRFPECKVFSVLLDCRIVDSGTFELLAVEPWLSLVARVA